LRDLFCMALQITEDLALCDEVAALNEQGFENIGCGGADIHQSALRLDSSQRGDTRNCRIVARRHYCRIGVPLADEFEQRDTGTDGQRHDDKRSRARLQSIKEQQCLLPQPARVERSAFVSRLATIGPIRVTLAEPDTSRLRILCSRSLLP